MMEKRKCVCARVHVCVTASVQQQHCCQAETSGEMGAARVFIGTPQQFESITSTRRARCVRAHTHIFSHPFDHERFEQLLHKV